MTPLDKKQEALQRLIADMGSLLVAFSGGVDSTLLLKVAVSVLGERVVAFTATSPTYPASELSAAKSLAREMGVRQVIVNSNELEIPGFAANPHDRCYHCKRELFLRAIATARDAGVTWVADGSTVDDLSDYRPGRRALQELGVRSPLLEAEFSKEEVRQLSRKLGLPTWDKQPFACLASRFPYGVTITEERLQQVAACEELLKQEGFSLYRVRYHGETARIELAGEEMARVLEPSCRQRITEGFRAAGFTYVALDLDGYRSGSMNETLDR
ncbi:MAG TPA: ATP-dependent sacrificial sulfur transferase LarE [Geobacterales bacterium]|nr:ATP-dependent sacrificial sulfur transferase LarE [Geobacterales bacterium]